MKFCKDCKHYQSQWLNKDYAMCARVISEVNGDVAGFCRLERQYDCGQSAQFWVEKEPTFLDVIIMNIKRLVSSDGEAK